MRARIRSQTEEALIEAKDANGGVAPAEGVVITNPRLKELEVELRSLRDENRHLKEANEELQGQMLNKGFELGQSLVNPPPGESIADELGNLPDNQV